MSRLVIGIGVDHSNKEIQIFDKYNIEHTDAYLEITKELLKLLNEKEAITYKVKLNDCTFENLQDFANKNQEDLKKIINKSKPKTNQKPKTSSTQKREHKRDLDNRFIYPEIFDAETANMHEDINDAAKALADLIKQLCPAGREQALALTKLEEAVMWATTSFVRGE